MNNEGSQKGMDNEFPITGSVQAAVSQLFNLDTPDLKGRSNGRDPISLHCRHEERSLPSLMGPHGHLMGAWQ